MPDDEFHLPAISADDAICALAGGTLVLVDLRKPEAARRSGQRIDGALVRDPYAFGHDDPLNGETRPIATFCVDGHEVSRFAAALLMLHGRDARYVTGGFAALVAAGAGTVVETAE